MTINNFINAYRDWFEQRDLREKFLVCAASWSVIYAIFSVTLFRIVDTRYDEITMALNKTNADIVTWKTQLKYLKSIPGTPLYKEWLKQSSAFNAIKKQYRSVIGKQGPDKWDDIIKTVLNNYPHITVENIQNGKETTYQTGKVQADPDAIYQQGMKITVIGNFQDIVNYLSSLEKALPNIHWDTLNYEVTEYPLARVTMEFSILYEKNKSA